MPKLRSRDYLGDSKNSSYSEMHGESVWLEVQALNLRGGSTRTSASLFG